MKLLLPFDGKPHSQRAVDLVRKCFDLSKIKVILLHVIEELALNIALSDKSGILESKYWDVSVQEGQQLIQTICDQLTKEGATVEPHLDTGKPTTVIKAMAEMSHIPIVVTTPGNHPPKDLMLESTVTNQLLLTEYEVLLVLARALNKSDKKPSCAFLLNGSEEAFRMLKLLTPLIQETMDIVVAVSAIGWLHANPDQFFEVRNPFLKDLKDPVETMKEAESILSSLDVKFEKLVLESSFDESYDALAKDRNLGLLAVSRSREDVLHRPLAGSAPERLFTSAACSTALFCSAVANR